MWKKCGKHVTGRPASCQPARRQPTTSQMTEIVKTWRKIQKKCGKNVEQMWQHSQPAKCQNSQNLVQNTKNMWKKYGKHAARQARSLPSGSLRAKIPANLENQSFNRVPYRKKSSLPEIAKPGVKRNKNVKEMWETGATKPARPAKYPTSTKIIGKYKKYLK